MAAELNHSVDVTHRLLPAQKHRKANSPTQSFTECTRSFTGEANSASRKALRRMCENLGASTNKSYSVKLRAHSVKLRVGLACFVGPQQAGAGGQLPSGRADRFLMRSASMPRNGQAAAAADLEQYGAFV